MPDSIHFRAYAEQLGRGSVLEWAVQRLRLATENLSDVYVLTNPSEAERVKNTLAGGSAALVRVTTGQGHFDELLQLANLARAVRLLILDLSAVLLPVGILKSLVRHHAAHGNDATRLVQHPCPMTPIVVEAKLIAELTRNAPALAQDLPSTLAMIDGFNRLRGFRSPIQIGPVGALALDEDEVKHWPYTVQLRDPDDVGILRTIVHEGELTIDGTQHTADTILRTWNERAREYKNVANIFPGKTAAQPPRHRSPSVLYVQSPSAFAGAEQVLLLLAEGMREEFQTAFKLAALIGLPGMLTEQLSRLGVDVRVVQRNFARNSVSYYRYSQRALDGIEPGIVHAHTVAGVPFCCAVAEKGVPFVQHVHVADERQLLQLEDQISEAAVVIAVSEFVKGRLLRLGTDPKKVVVIHNGTPLNAARLGDWDARARVRRACGVPDDAPIITVVARFAANKRHDVALNAFARLRGWIPGAHLLLAGDMPASDRSAVENVNRWIRRLGLSDSVHFLGLWRDMPSLYAATDVVLLPSEDEPFGMAVVEAMASGVPVIASRSGGIPEIITHEESGVLCDPGDVGGFANALERTLTDHEFRTAVVDAALTRSATEFSVSRFVHRVGALYTHLLAGDVFTGDDHRIRPILSRTVTHNGADQSDA